jgi:hypothetical protein
MVCYFSKNAEIGSSPRHLFNINYFELPFLKLQKVSNNCVIAIIIRGNSPNIPLIFLKIQFKNSPKKRLFIDNIEM